MFTQILSVLCMALAVSAEHPNFCHDLDCPDYTVLETGSGYELRHYNATKWAAVTMSGATRDSVNSAMFMKLFHYIDGQNIKQEKIPMTAPVLVTVTHGQGPNCASNFTMHFMIPHNQWSHPLEPTDSHVHIVTVPAMDVYVKGFGGYAQDDDYTRHVAELYDAIPKSSDVHVATDTFYTAGYDSPYQFFLRHNEVWIQRLP